MSQALQLELPNQSRPGSISSELRCRLFEEELRSFSEFGTSTAVLQFESPRGEIPVYVNEFWTAKQRDAHSLHEVSYRACFKPQLPRFFIERLSAPGDLVYDPFMGRGTTLLEAAFHGRVPCGTDINPLSRVLLQPRLSPPSLKCIQARLVKLDLSYSGDLPEDLLVFYHPETLGQISALRNYFADEQALDDVDRWLRMVASNRLTGHSPGFFSVYTLPPNQAVSVESQRKINRNREQTPPKRDVPKLLYKKSVSLLKDLTASESVILGSAANQAQLMTGSAECSNALKENSVQLVVTSPPFLDVVNYRTDNWLRCWFNNIDSDSIQTWQLRSQSAWQEKMTEVFSELKRVLKPGGYVAFEVGEVRGGTLLLESLVIPAAADAGLTPVLVMVNQQTFTKTSNCWGVDNLRRGTSSNRIALLRKD